MDGVLKRCKLVMALFSSYYFYHQISTTGNWGSRYRLNRFSLSTTVNVKNWMEIYE